MLGKLGLLVVLATFGIVMFVAGMHAPDSLRSSFSKINQHFSEIREIYPTGVEGKSPGKPAAPSTSMLQKKQATVVSQSAETQVADTLPSESLLLPTPLPDKAQYGVQVGRFSDTSQAQALSKRILKMKLRFQSILSVVDQGGNRWAIVPIGPYSSVDEARTAGIFISSSLQLEESLPLILWPAAKPKN